VPLVFGLVHSGRFKLFFGDVDGHKCAYLADKDLYVTQTALDELLGGSIKAANAEEVRNAYYLLLSTTVVRDDPSERVVGMVASSRAQGRVLDRPNGMKDRVLFGTGDRHGMVTYTGDVEFSEVAADRGVDLTVEVHTPAPRFAGPGVIPR
jgi:hypothetical protein